MDDNEMSEIDSGADWRPIERLLYAYAWIVEQRKWELMDSVFAPDATIDYTRTGGKKGPYRPTLESPGAASLPDAPVPALQGRLYRLPLAIETRAGVVR